jgi:hypothetical protein
MDLLYSLLVMIRAHEESATKSQRIRASIRRRCEQWVAGTYRGKVSSGKDPSWVVWQNGKFELIPERAAGLRQAVKMYLDGFGFVVINRALESAGVKINNCKADGHAYVMLQNESLSGVRVLTTGGETFRLVGYYPAVLSADEYAHLRVEMGKRSQQTRSAGGKSLAPGLFTGTGVGICGGCGGGVVTQNQNKTIKSGPIVYRKYRCGGACYDKKIADRRKSGSIPAHVLEKVILDYCSDQINLQSLILSSDSIISSLRAELVAARSALQDAERRGEKLMEIMLASDGDTPQMLVKKAREVEVEIAALKDAVVATDAKLSVASQVVDEDIYAKWADVRAGVLNLDYAARLKCRQLIADTFTRVTVYFGGVGPDTAKDTTDVVLVSKSGNSRWLTFNRKTGEFIRGLNLDKNRGEIGGLTFNQPVTDEHLVGDVCLPPDSYKRPVR